MEHRLTPGQLVDATVRYLSQPARGGRNGRGVSEVEHFEIAPYRTLIEAAAEAGEDRIDRACEEILREEDMADWLAQHRPEVTRQYLYREAARRKTPAARDMGDHA